MQTWLPGEDDNLCVWDYTFTAMISKNDKEHLTIDAGSIATSNWLRFVNCPRSPAEENVEARQCFSEMLYQATKDIPPGTELLVYYGDSYAKELGISTEAFNDDSVYGKLFKNLLGLGL